MSLSERSSLWSLNFSVNDLSVTPSVCLSSVLWKNGRSDLDAVWHRRSNGSRDEAGSGVWGSVNRKGYFWGEFGARHCNQWRLYGIRVRQCRDTALIPNYFGQTCLELHEPLKPVGRSICYQLRQMASSAAQCWRNGESLWVSQRKKCTVKWVKPDKYSNLCQWTSLYRIAQNRCVLYS